MVMDSEKAHRAAFAKRLNELLDEIGVPAKHRGRQVAVAKMFGVSQKGARKWLEGEALPEDHRIPGMAEQLNTTEEHLRWGKGPLRPEPELNAPLAYGTQPLREQLPALYGRQRYRADSMLIDQLNVGGGMARDGIMAPEHVDVVHQVRVNINDLRRVISFTAPHNLRVVTGYGDSMHPTFSDGDPLIVDIGVNDVTIDAVYVLERENNTDRRDIFIKRIQRRPITNEWLMISDNTIYPPQIITAEEWKKFKVSARVLIAWNARRL